MRTAGRSLRRWAVVAVAALTASALTQPSAEAAGTTNGVMLVAFGDFAVTPTVASGDLSFIDPPVTGDTGAFSHDGAKIAYTACTFDDCQIRIRTAAGADDLITTVQGTAWDLSWSPDDTKIAYAQIFNDFTINEVGVGGSATPTTLFPNDWSQQDPSYAPNGKLLFIRGNDVFVDGVQLTHECIYGGPDDGQCDLDHDGIDRFYSHPTMSSDGTIVAQMDRFHFGPDPDWSGVVTLSSGGDPTELVQFAQHPVWAPDGSVLSYAYPKSGTSGAMTTRIGIGAGATVLQWYAEDWQPCPNGICVSWTKPREPSSITLNYSVTKTVRANGQVTPAHSGQPITVTLWVQKGTKWVQVASKKPTLSSMSRYVASFPLQNKYLCKLVAKFPGDSDHKSSKAEKLMSC